METDLVSIIMPVHNCCKYIVQAIISVKMQTYKNWELIIIDDASTDNTLQEIQNVIKDIKDRVKLIELGKNKGVANARNIGLKQAKGRYIAYLDADDFWKKEKIEHQIGFMKRNKYYFTYTSYIYLIGNKQKRVGKVSERLTYKQALKNTIILTSTVIIDTNEISKDLLEMPNIQSEDTATWWNILKNKKIANGLNEELTIYRIRKDSLSKNKLKSAKNTWNLYRKKEKLGYAKTCYYFANYVINAVKKRIKTKEIYNEKY